MAGDEGDLILFAPPLLYDRGGQRAHTINIDSAKKWSLSSTIKLSTTMVQNALNIDKAYIGDKIKTDT